MALYRDKPIRAWPISSKRVQRHKTLYSFRSEAFYKALNAIVEARGVSLRQVARDCGITPSTLTHMSRGRGISGDTLAALSAWARINPGDYVQINVRRPDQDEERLDGDQPSPSKDEKCLSQRQEPSPLEAVFQIL